MDLKMWHPKTIFHWIVTTLWMQRPSFNTCSDTNIQITYTIYWDILFLLRFFLYIWLSVYSVNYDLWVAFGVFARMARSCVIINNYWILHVLQENGYQLLFLSARAIVQAYLTRSFLLNLKQVFFFHLS